MFHVVVILTAIKFGAIKSSEYLNDMSCTILGTFIQIPKSCVWAGIAQSV